MAAVLAATSPIRARGIAGILASAVLALCANAPAADAKPIVGIAEQQAAAFTNPLFTPLGVRYARLNLAWDAMRYGWQLAELDAWMTTTHAAGIEPLVIFSQSRVKGRSRILPTPRQYGVVIDQLLARYPWVREFATWNEANHSGQPTAKSPARVAAYYETLRRHCAGCRIAAASLLDDPQLVAWARRLRSAIHRRGLPDPKLWALHNYIDVNNLRDTSTRAFLRGVQGTVWLTETGGIVRATSPRARRFKQGPQRAATVLKYILGPMATRNPRITRIYVYNFFGAAAPATWDSGLVTPAGNVRPSYRVVKDWFKGKGRSTVAR
ncbi:unannotated protein [freshwater metagenome]|uniref:Unannotated protein n=1 Tax=freshwater metagenome TaxID=449393 RepID=A0A6J7HWN9_9ZZZZ|nr:hypothetical protein [Actinomycetota bacterium]